MTHDIQSQMFEPFFSTKATNMGLGLTLVHGMIRQHGGTVDVESHLGRGTTVRVFFPIEPRTGPVQQRGGSTGPVSRSHETILIVESDEIERKLAVATLNRQRYRVLEAESAVQALMVAQQHAGSIHLAVSNLSMEDISGRELVRRLVLVPSEDEGSVRLRVHGRDDGASPLEYATASTGQLLAGLTDAARYPYHQRVSL